MQHDRIIEQLGGVQTVADALGRHPGRVRHWRRRIPAEVWPAIVDLATERGLPEITFDALHAGAKAAA